MPSEADFSHERLVSVVPEVCKTNCEELDLRSSRDPSTSAFTHTAPSAAL